LFKNVFLLIKFDEIFTIFISLAFEQFILAIPQDYG